MRVLAIDPGYDRCGVAVVEKNQNKEKVLFSTCLRTSVEDVFEQRLHMIHQGLVAIITEYKPTVTALERLYFNNNQKTAMRVAEVRGMCIQLATSHGMSVCEYTPPQIKLAVAGSGRASKSDIIRMVHMLVHLSAKDERRVDDEYDAIALGITHLVIARVGVQNR